MSTVYLVVKNNSPYYSIRKKNPATGEYEQSTTTIEVTGADRRRQKTTWEKRSTARRLRKEGKPYTKEHISHKASYEGTQELQDILTGLRAGLNEEKKKIARVNFGSNKNEDLKNNLVWKR